MDRGQVIALAPARQTSWLALAGLNWRSLDARFARSCGGEWLGGRHGRKASTMSREHGGR
jgi:hypothetical protein